MSAALREQSHAADTVGIAFDLGDVLLTDATKTGFNLLEEELGIPAESARYVWMDTLRIPAELGDIDEGTIWSILAALTPGANPGDVRTIFLSEFKEISEGIGALRTARSAGWRIAIATNHVAEWIPLWQERFEWFGLVDMVFNSAVMKTRKPEPRFYEMVKAGLGSTEFIFVDDNPTNVAAAVECGFRGFVAEPGNSDWIDEVFALEHIT